jgi:seryl-tRNA synthetase
MLDVQLLRGDLAGVAKRLADRGYTLDAAAFEALEASRKAVQTETQELQAKRNQLSKQIGQIKAKGEDASQLMVQVNAQADRLKALEQELEGVQTKLNDFLRDIPNVPHASVPAGKSAADNPEVRRVGAPRVFDFPVKDHVDVGEGLGLLDFATASKLAGGCTVRSRSSCSICIRESMATLRSMSRTW